VNDVFGIGLPQPEPAREADEPPRIAIIKISERRTIAVGDADDQGFVRRSVRVQGAPRSDVVDGVVFG